MTAFSPAIGSALYIHRLADPAVSEDARSASTKVAHSLQQYGAIGINYLRDEILRLAANENGEVAEPDEAVDWIAQSAAAMALEFLNLLPRSLPLPEIIPDVDGEAEFDWAGPSGKAVTLSIDGGGRIAFAARLGDRRRLHGEDQVSNEAAASIADLVRKALR